MSAGEVRVESGPPETAYKGALLVGVAQASQSDVGTVRAEPFEEASDRRRPAHGHDADALGLQIPTTAASERFERELVTDPLDQHDGQQVDWQDVEPRGTSAASQFMRRAPTLESSGLPPAPNS